jgi:mono/diheme cytochrome c family protein
MEDEDDYGDDDYGRDDELSWHQRYRVLMTLVIGIPLLIAVWAALRFIPYRAVTYASNDDHFKYGSTGGYRNGFPYWIWRALPVVFHNHLPKDKIYHVGKEYEAFGLVYEPGHDLPIGMQRGRNTGIDRVFLNCAICHHSTVREKPDGPRTTYLGMPAARFDIGAFQQFLFDIGTDDRFNADNIIPEVERQGGRLSPLDRYLIYPIAIGLLQQRLVFLRQRLGPTHPEAFGPGRDDTFNPEKGLWGFPMDKLPDHELHGIADFPAIWNQRKKRGMQLHWDGNNNEVTERNKNAALATGATPATVDMPSMDRLAKWNFDLPAPKYPFPIDTTLAKDGEPIYAKYCAYCHGRNGQDFSGAYVGKVTPIEYIKTDRYRLDSFTYELAVNLGTPYAGEVYRFKHFRKTYGYANLPLDGLWLRGPYLHNGSVPTLSALLTPAARPKTFYRGYDVFDQENVGFKSDVPDENGWKYFFYDTGLPGNGNGGHDYGAELLPHQKKALIEFLKTF